MLTLNLASATAIALPAPDCCGVDSDNGSPLNAGCFQETRFSAFRRRASDGHEIGGAMSIASGLPVNFTISDNAKQAIEQLRLEWNQKFPDPADVLSIGWGQFAFNSGERFENVVVSFYGRSERPRIEPSVERVADLDVLFFVTKRDYAKFEGRILDYSPQLAYFLR